MNRLKVGFLATCLRQESTQCGRRLQSGLEADTIYRMSWPAIEIFLMGLIAFAAWGCMTFAPIAMGFGSWALVKRVRHGWIAHILFLPALLGLEWLLVDLMFWGARDDGDGPPGLGLAMIPACAILVITVAIYYAALGILGATAMLKKMKSVRGISVR